MKNVYHLRDQLLSYLKNSCNVLFDCNMDREIKQKALFLPEL